MQRVAKSQCANNDFGKWEPINIDHVAPPDAPHLAKVAEQVNWMLSLTPCSTTLPQSLRMALWQHWKLVQLSHWTLPFFPSTPLSGTKKQQSCYTQPLGFVHKSYFLNWIGVQETDSINSFWRAKGCQEPLCKCWFGKKRTNKHITQHQLMHRN